MSTRRTQMVGGFYKDIHIDSDFSDTKDPGQFTINLQNSLHNVTTMAVHSVTLPQVIPPLNTKVLRWTIDEEKDARPSYPSVFDDPGAADKTVFTASVSGNFSTDQQYRRIGEAMVDAMQGQLPSIGLVHETTGIGATNFWRSTPNVVDTAGGADPVSGETGHEPLNQFDTYTPVNVGGVTEYNFVPRIIVRINKDSKTDIYSNFKLRLRPAAYNGEVDQNPATSLAETMGFTITDASGNLLDDPGVRTYLRQAKNSLSVPAHTVITDQGELINGQYYFYKLTSEKPANFQPDRYLFVTTPNIFIRSQQSNPIIYGHNVIAKLPLTNYGTVPTFTKDTFTEHYIDVNDITTIFIRIIDESGNEPDFQEVGGFSMHLRIWYDGQ